MSIKRWVMIGAGLVIGIVGAYLVLAPIVAWYVALSGNLRTALTGIVGVLLVPVITFLTARTLERRRSRDDAIREHRTNLYDTTIRGLITMFGIAGQQKKSETEMAKLFAKITPDLLLYGSRDVIRAWNRFRTTARLHPGDTLRLALSVEDFMREMRRDLGHSVAPPAKFELLGVFVNDPENLRPSRRMRRLTESPESSSPKKSSTP